MIKAGLAALAVALLGVAGLSAEDRVGEGTEIDPGPGRSAGLPLTAAPVQAAVPAPVTKTLGPDAFVPDAPVPLPASGPEVVAEKPKSVFAIEMEDFSAAGSLSPSSKKAYELLAETKTLVLQMAADLDAGGKEKTRLLQSTQALCGCINQLAKLWPDNDDYRLPCVSAKSRTLALEEEIGAEMPRWKNVRWSFQEVQKEVAKLRRKVAELAEQEPKLVRVVRNGREVLVEPGQSAGPDLRKAAEERRRESQQQADKLRRWEKEHKKTGDDIAIPKDK